jgi:threonine/homoserine efflux transporter RhtA
LIPYLQKASGIVQQQTSFFAATSAGLWWKYILSTKRACAGRTADLATSLALASMNDPVCQTPSME